MTEALQLPDFTKEEVAAIRAFVAVTLRLGIGTETVQDGVLTFKERQLLAWYQEQPRPFKMLLTNVLFQLQAVGTTQPYKPSAAKHTKKGLLSDTHRAILIYTRDFIDRCGYPPSLREIGSELSLSITAVARHLEVLEAKGYLTYQSGKPRTIHVLKDAETS